MIITSPVYTLNESMAQKQLGNCYQNDKRPHAGAYEKLFQCIYCIHSRAVMDAMSKEGRRTPDIKPYRLATIHAIPVNSPFFNNRGMKKQVAHDTNKLNAKKSVNIVSGKRTRYVQKPPVHIVSIAHMTRRKNTGSLRWIP